MDSRTKRQTFGPRGCLPTADPDINSSQEKAMPFACVSLLFDGECICVCCGCCCRHPSITLVPASPTFPHGLRTRNSLGILQAFRSQIGTAEIFQLHNAGRGWTTRTLLCNILGYVCFSSHFSRVSSCVGKAFLSIQSQSIVCPISEILPSCFQHPFCISPSQCKQYCLSTEPSLGPLFLLGTVYLPLF